MNADSTKNKINENVDVVDLAKMQTELGLAESRSKTLTVMVIVGLLLTSGLFWLLFEMTG